jgi:hypothetical protein
MRELVDTLVDLAVLEDLIVLAVVEALLVPELDADWEEDMTLVEVVIFEDVNDALLDVAVGGGRLPEGAP